MKYLHSSFFKSNRERLSKNLSDDTLMILLSNDIYPKNGDQNFAFRQQSDFFYFTGIKQEGSIFILYKNKEGELNEHLFIIKPNLKLETWEGKKLTIEESQIISGIDQVKYVSSYDKILESLVQKTTKFLLLGEDAYLSKLTWDHKHQSYLLKLKKQYPKHKFESPRKQINQLRLVKTEEELDMMKHAIGITDKAFQRVLEVVRPGMFEFELEAEISYIFKKSGVRSHAYDPIIAAGENACTLHYVENNQVLGPQELLLMDFGAEWQYYAADLSRTIPVSGTYTKRQRQIYNIVLEVQKQSIPLFVPGNTINKVNKETKALMQKALEANQISGDIDVLFPHGTSHFLGLDVHDVGDKDIPFEKGMVLTCEPGLYLKDERIGVRIENDILVDDVPQDLMEDIIREPEAIEEAMSRK